MMTDDQQRRLRRITENRDNRSFAEVVEQAFIAGMAYRVPRGSSMSLTRKQRDLLTFIEEYTTDNNGVAPSYDEMKDALGLRSKSGIHRMIVALEERGKIRRMPEYARAIEVIHAA